MLRALCPQLPARRCDSVAISLAQPRAYPANNLKKDQKTEFPKRRDKPFEPKARGIDLGLENAECSIPPLICRAQGCE